MTEQNNTPSKRHLEMQQYEYALIGLEAVSTILTYIDALEDDPETQPIDYFDCPETRRDLLYAVWVLARYARSNLSLDMG